MILIDTHVVLWLAFEQQRLSKTAQATIESARKLPDGLAICDVTLLEITNLVLSERIRLDTPLDVFLQRIANLFVIVPITPRACVQIASLPEDYPKDPADRIIGGTALAEGIALLTADREIRSCKLIRTIW